MEPELFGSDMSLGLVQDVSGAFQNSQFPVSFEMSPNQ